MKTYKLIKEFLPNGIFLREADYKLSTNSLKFNIDDKTGYFLVYDVVETYVEVDGKKVKCIGYLKEEPITYYVDGWIYGLEEFKESFPLELETISRIEYLQKKTSKPLKIVAVDGNYYIYGKENKLWKRKFQKKN